MQVRLFLCLTFLPVLTHRYHGEPHRAEVLRATVTFVCGSSHIWIYVPPVVADIAILCVSSSLPHPQLPVLCFKRFLVLNEVLQLCHLDIAM